MYPCDNCGDHETCAIIKFLLKNFDKPIDTVVDFLFNNHPFTSVVSMVSGKKDSIKLECKDYKPIKEEVDYSGLVGRIHHGHEASCDNPNCRRCKR